MCHFSQDEWPSFHRGHLLKRADTFNLVDPQVSHRFGRESPGSHIQRKTHSDAISFPLSPQKAPSRFFLPCLQRGKGAGSTLQGPHSSPRAPLVGVSGPETDGRILQANKQCYPSTSGGSERRCEMSGGESESETRMLCSNMWLPLCILSPKEIQPPPS